MTPHVHDHACIGMTELEELCCATTATEEQSGYTVWLPGDRDGTPVFAASPADAAQLAAVDRGLNVGAEINARVELTPRNPGFGEPV